MRSPVFAALLVSHAFCQASLAQPANDLTPGLIAPVPLMERKPLDERRPNAERAVPAAPALNVGDPAPQLKVESYLKGTPIRVFEPGKVYVVEFWATWCGPCLRAFPHLTALQNRFREKGVVVIGTNIWERYDAGTLDRVAAFVAERDSEMGYTVAFDGKSGRAAKDWMTAANQNGIPTAFIVDRQGLLAWIGHPTQIDTPLTQIIEGTYDMTAASLQHKEAAAAEARRVGAADDVQKLMGVLRTHQKAKDWAKVMQTYDMMAEADPDRSGIYLVRKFNTLIGPAADFKRAYGLQDALLDDAVISTDPRQLGEIAWTIVKPGSPVPAAERDLRFALVFAERANEVSSGEDPMILDTLARIHSEMGEHAKAVEWQEKAVKAMEVGQDVIPDTLESLRRTLNVYRKNADDDKKRRSHPAPGTGP